MSDPTMHDRDRAPDADRAPRESGADELRDGDLEEVSGGVIEGGCIQLPWEKSGTTG